MTARPKRHYTRLSDIIGPKATAAFIAETKRLQREAAALRAKARRGVV